MSSATPSRPTPSVTDDGSTAAAWIDRLASGVRATAFWTATVLPLFLVAGLVVGSAGQHPAVLAGVLALNVVCAVVGHSHTPRR